MENQSPPFGFNVLRVFDSVFFVEEANEPKQDDVQIRYSLGLHTDVEESWVQYNIRVDFWTDTTKVFVTGTVVTKFGIDNLKAFIKDDNLAWPPNVLETMFSIAFTHTRALLAKNMAPTRFSNYIVPLINHVTVFNQLMQTQPGFEQVVTDDTQHPKSNRNEKVDIEDIELSPANSDENEIIKAQLKKSQERLKKLTKMAEEKGLIKESKKQVKHN
ncbi:MAG TPA: hypothetical protein VIJ27_07530 [Mucilaginibacter sp.]